MKIWVTDKESLINKIENKTKGCKTIVSGDKAIDKWTLNQKKKFNLDLIIPKENIENFVEKLKTIREVSNIEINKISENITKITIDGLLKDGIEWVVKLKINLDTSLTREEINEIKKLKLAIEVGESGWFLTPELLTTNEFKRALDLTSSIKKRNNDGSIKSINYKKQAPIHTYNFLNLTHCNNLDSKKLKLAKDFIEKVSKKSISIEKFENIKWLSNFDGDFSIDFLGESEKWDTDTYFDIFPNIVSLETLKNKIYKKKEKEINKI